MLFCTVAWLGGGGGSGDAAVWAVGGLFFNVLFCTVAWRGFGGGVSGVGGEADGRLSASATTFCDPGTCLRSVVNSEM